MLEAKHRIILGIAILASIIRLAYVFFYPQIPVVHDSKQYDDIAVNVSQGKGFPVTMIGSEYKGVTRTPGYPVFLSFIYSIFGHSYQAVRIIQALVDVLTCLIVFYLGSTIFNFSAGCIAALSYAFYFPVIIYTGVLYTETLFSMMLVVAMLFLLMAVKHNHFIYWMLSGLFLGVVTLISSRSELVPVFILVALLLNKYSLRESFMKIGIIVLFMLIVISPWTIRNYLVTGKFILLENYNQDGRGLWLATNPYGAMTWSEPKVKELVKGMPLNERVIFFQKEAFKNLKRYPLSYILNSIRRFFTLLFSSHGSHILGLQDSFYSAWKEKNWPMLCFKSLLFCINLLFVVFGFLGLWFCGIRGGKEKFVLLVPIFYFIILHTFYVSSARLQIPIIPYMMIFSVLGVDWLLKLIFLRKV